MISLQASRPIQTILNQVVGNEIRIVNPNTILSNQEGFFSNSFNIIKNICYRNIKKIPYEYMLCFAAAQALTGACFSNTFFKVSGLLTASLAIKIMSIETMDKLKRLNTEFLQKVQERIREHSQTHDLMQEIPLKAYENLQRYPEKADGNIETIILQTSIKDVDKVVYYDKQFYDYDALATWYNLSDARSKLCPHNRQPLILDNLLRVDKQNIV